MKIMMIAAADSIHAVRWANAFVVQGYHVDFVTLANHKPKKDVFEEGINIIYLKHNGTKGYILNAIELNHLWKKIKPDVINVHYASGYGLLVRLARLKKVVLSVWGSDVYDFPTQNWLTHMIVKKNILYADAVASTSYCMAKQVERVTGKKVEEIKITPFGVDINLFKPEKKHTTTDFKFGIIKKLTYKYGIDYAIKAFGIVLRKYRELCDNSYPPPHLFICGKGENKSDFEELRDNLGLHDYIEIQGYIPHKDIPMLMNTLDVFCLSSSSSESFGVAAVEAMACGLPIIATDVDGFKEVIIDGKTGYIVPKRNEEKMADKMWELYLDANKREEFGRNGRKHVLDNYIWDNNVDNLLSVLTEVSKRR